MNIQKLFQMQSELDERIGREHGLTGKNVVEEKILALLVELGELANETRCFKFWSKKGPSDLEVILEEYVDGLHFILSLGLEINIQNEFKVLDIEGTSNMVNQFHSIYKIITTFRNDMSREKYSLLFNEYLHLGEILGFSKDQIEKAYIEKNEVNHQRQDQGY